MEQKSFADRRKQKLSSIRLSLAKNPAILATTALLQQKREKKQRRTSIQIGEMQVPQIFQEIASDDEDSNNISLFNEKYCMGEKAGEGAHGVVKQCIEKKTGQTFAVKIITLERQHILFLKNNFIDIQALKHKHILTYKALYFQLKNGRCYLVMDYLPFPNLQETEIESEDELKLVIYQLLQAVKYIHQNKICHRDIKPENILYDRENQSITIIDFGISKKVEFRGRKKEMLTLTGTPYYRAPQMFEGGGYDEMVDMWAIGVTIFKLITGYTPFESEYHSDTIANIMKGEVVFPSKLKFECSQAPKNLVKRLLKRSKTDRLTAEAALKDPWFLDIKNNGEEELIRSMVLNKKQMMCKLKMSVKYHPNEISQENMFQKVQKGPESYKILAAQIKQQSSNASIFGMDQSFQI